MTQIFNSTSCLTDPCDNTKIILYDVVRRYSSSNWDTARQWGQPPSTYTMLWCYYYNYSL